MKNEIQNLINIINEKEKTHQNKIKEVELYQEQIRNLQNKFKQREIDNNRIFEETISKMNQQYKNEIEKLILENKKLIEKIKEVNEPSLLDKIGKVLNFVSLIVGFL